MKKTLLFSTILLLSSISIAQNVGVGTTTPTHTLHVLPSIGNDPLRVNGLNQYSSERNLFIVDPTSGVVKHIHVDSLASVITGGLGTDDQNIDSLSLTGNILTVHIEDGNPAAIDLSAITGTGSDDQNIDSLSLIGTTLTVYIENGSSANIDLSALQDGTGTDDQNLDSLRLTGNMLTAYIENGASASLNIQPIIDSAIANSTGTDDQNLQTPTLLGTTLTTNIENGSSTSINLQPLIDSAIANSTGDSDWDINSNGTGLEGNPGANIASGDYAIAGGFNNQAIGNAAAISGGQINHAPGFATSISGGVYNYAAGYISTISGGQRDTATGQYSVVAGGAFNHAFESQSTVSGGQNNRAGGRNSTVSGGLNNTAYSFGEWVGGIYSTTYSPISTTVWNANDRLFVVGNGTSTSTRSNGLVLYKDGSLEINEEYTLPNVDGSANQVLTTNGTGNVSWQAASSGGDSDWDINGNGTGLEGNPGTNVASGGNSIAAGNGNTASGTYAVAFGQNNNAAGNHSVALGQSNLASGNHSFVMGRKNVASGEGSFAFGRHFNTFTDSIIASGDGAFAHGSVAYNGAKIEASGLGSTAWGHISSVGTQTILASATGATAWGSSSKATGSYATAWSAGVASGSNATAWGLSSATSTQATAWGQFATASGSQSTAWGRYTIANGATSTAFGRSLHANTNLEVAIGLFNDTSNSPSTNNSNWVGTDALLTAGNGTSGASRNNAFILYKNGNATFDNGSINITSDRRLKESILPLNNSLQNILNLNGYYYYWKNKELRGDEKQIGVMAQEIEKLYPELIRQENNNKKSVNYMGLIPVLIEATKQQQEIIEEEKNKNLKLEQRLSELEEIVNKLLEK